MNFMANTLTMGTNFHLWYFVTETDPKIVIKKFIK